jgi:pullulanase
VYELHIRDFSVCDASVAPELRGKYLAFDPQATGGQTRGQQHLAQLKDSGLTHVHLLPSYDFGSVPEKAQDQLEVEIDLTQFSPGAPASKIEA